MSDQGSEISNVLKLLDAEQLKTAVLLLPLAGTLTAVTYDVGYFRGVDLGYFTVFSLAEHIGFALEVAPFAIFITLLYGTVAILLRPIFLPDNEHRRKDSVLGILSGIAVAGLGIWWLSGMAMALWLALLAVIAILILVKGRIKQRSVSVVFNMLALYGTIYFFGYDVGNRHITNNIPTHLLNDETSGRLIRSGERGVLFVTKGDKQIVLFRWDVIKSIKSIKLSTEEKLQNLFGVFFRRE